ncbi:hypothetical protein CEXT_195241 [Caerostris extrusa]|uniref:Uncharacterized protein n=1 Tax=Caerostris extrusa TaxID=172846 RepID=A0AAV4REE3_CAEEX|nr:hypothetical protein CEXT_195241 [Caerostris extrusa]
MLDWDQTEGYMCYRSSRPSVGSLGSWKSFGKSAEGECYAVTLISGTCIRRSFVKHIKANAYDTAVQDLLDQDKHFSNECSLTAVHGTFSGKFESSLFSFQVV